MNILRFMETFPDEASCKEHFRLRRQSEGVKCKKCGHTEHYWLKGKWQWQCKSCGFRTCLRSGTVFSHSKLPIHKWYLAMCMMTMSKKGFSAKEMQRQLGHSRYESIWRMMHVIREAMGKRDALYKLEGMVEFDEGYIKKSTPKCTKLKRGKGSQGKQNVAVVAESTPLEDLNSGRTSRQCRYFKMQVLDSHKSDAINEVIKKSLSESTIVFSDKSKSYVDISEHVELHIEEKSTNETSKTIFQWVHITISNAKRWLLGIHHQIKGKYLQSYLNEFCYKLNRRYFGDRIFDRLTLAMAKSYW